MKRREFVAGAAAGVAGSGLLISGCGEGPGARRRGVGGGNREQVNWRLASSFPGSLDVLYGSVVEFCERVKEMTGGNFEIRPYQGGEIVPALEVLDAVGRGSVEMGHTASYYFIGKNPALAFDCTVPFGLTFRQQNSWLYSGGGLDLLRPIFADFNVINIPGGNTGVQMGGWFREPIERLDDLRGRKMRIPGLGGKVMERLGVTAQVIPGGEVYISLERGAIDAAEWVGPHDDVKLGLHEVAKNYYYPGWWEPGVTIGLLVNLDEFNALPVAYQETLKTVCHETFCDRMAAYAALNPAALERLVNDHGVVVRPYSEDIMEAAWRESNTYLVELSAENAEFRRMYESYVAFRNIQWAYARGNDLTYQEWVMRRVIG